MEEMNCFDERYKSRMRWEVVQALLHSLPSGLIESYVLASMRFFDSDLLTAESDPLHFLRLENNNIQRAAYKLALSWYKRRACFGEMAFLPMSQIGMAALTEQVAQGLSCLQQLPNDKHGNAVYIINAPKITRSLSTSGARALFYQLHLVNKIGTVVFLFLACGNSSFDEMAMFFGLLSELVNEALPLKAIRVHILSLQSTTMVKSTVQLILEKHLSDHVVVTEEIAAQDLAPKLECFGLTKEGLPPFLGGTLGTLPATSTAAADKLQDATDDAAQQPSPWAAAAPPGISMTQGGLYNPHTGHERPPVGIGFTQGHSHYYLHSGHGQLPPAPQGIAFAQGHSHYYLHTGHAGHFPPPQGIANSQSVPYYSHTGHEQFFPPPVPSFLAAKPSATMKMPPTMSNKALGHDQASSNTVMMNSSYCHEQSGCVTASDPSHNHNVAPGFPCQEAAVGNLQNPREQKEEIDLTAKRERNAFYSRRKYARKKIEIEVTQDEARRLQQENSAFRQEQERLESLILQAQACIEIHNTSNTTSVAPPAEKTAAVESINNQDHHPQECHDKSIHALTQQKSK